MPIKGLSDQRRLIRLGKIRLGIKKFSEKTGKEYPCATDYFVIPEQIKKYFPEKPTEIPIMIPVEDDEIWCSQYYKCYSSYRGLTCKGDGATCRRMLDKTTGDKANRDTKEVVWKEMACWGQGCPDYQSKECKETMNLQFIMPDIPGLGVWQIDTGSINSIRNINNGARMIRAVYNRIKFINLLLTLEPAEVVNPDDGKKKTVRLLYLRTHETMRSLMIQANQPVTELLLPGPAEDEPPMDDSYTESEEKAEGPGSSDSPSPSPAPAASGAPGATPEKEVTWEMLGRSEQERKQFDAAREAREAAALKGSKQPKPAPNSSKEELTAGQVSTLRPREEWDQIAQKDVPGYLELELVYCRLTGKSNRDMYKELGGGTRTDQNIPAWDAFLGLKNNYYPKDMPK